MLITFYVYTYHSNMTKVLKSPFTPEVSPGIIVVNFSNDVEEIPYLSWN